MNIVIYLELADFPEDGEYDFAIAVFGPEGWHHWKKICDDTSCPLYSIEGGSDFCNALSTKLIGAFNEWKEDEETPEEQGMVMRMVLMEDIALRTRMITFVLDGGCLQ